MHMKHDLYLDRFVILISSVLLVLSLPGCDQSTGSGSAASTETSTTAYAASWSYASDSPIFEVDSYATSLTISGLETGQKIYLAKTNTSASASISSSNARYVTNGSGLTLSTAETASSSSGTGSSPGLPVSSAAVTNFVAPVNLSPSNFTKSVSLGRSVSAAVTSVTPLELTVDTTTKDIYVDQDENISSFTQETATLRAEGTYCNVWVVNDNFSTDGTSSGEQIDSSLALALADTFDAIYPMIRTVFGDESENLYAYSSGSVSEIAMATYDDTGTYENGSSENQKVNIVVYDIANDYSTSSGSSTGIVGYFYNKDYYYNTGTTLSSMNGYKIIDYSNAGKYFYIDAYYAVDYTDAVFSTLAHEFQHMINWGIKAMDHDLDPSTWYNEMLSMLSEEIMRDSLGISYDDAPEARLPFFERCYKDNGIEYRSTSSYTTLLSYANSYAFGAWAVREFGGAQVISAMARNSYVDMDSVVRGINSVNGTSYDAEDLLRMYAEACIFSDTDLGMPSFNQQAEETLTYSGSDTSYTYPVEALDLWNLADIFTSDFTDTYTSSTYYKYDGPKLYGYNAAYEIRPYGMTLVDVGTATDDSVTLTFTSNGSSAQHLYVMVQ